MRKRDFKNGYIFLALLIAIVIVALLYMIDVTAVFGPRGKIDIYAERPWFEDNRLVSDNNFPIKQTGKKGKVVILELTKLNATVMRNNEDRGNLQITIDPNGKAFGIWSCAYKYPDSSYAIDAEFSGNIDPTKNYEDANGTNKQPLYFITKGNSQQTKTDSKTNEKWTGEEAVYVVGWIQKDFSARGKLFLMTEDGGHNEYDWQTK